VIRRLYINNYRGLDNFELSIAGQSSVLLIGKNGSGKSTVRSVLEVLQRIGLGTIQAGSLVKFKDFTRGRTPVPMRIEIDVELDGKSCEYVVAFVVPDGTREIAVFEEKFSIGGSVLYKREYERMKALLALTSNERDAQTRDAGSQGSRQPWADHLATGVVALPVLGNLALGDPVSVFTLWLSRMLILEPMPDMITGDSEGETLVPDRTVASLGAWFSGLLAGSPAAYTRIAEYLKLVIPDFSEIKNLPTGRASRSLFVQFANGPDSMSVPFQDLSAGEKCFMICALVLACANSDAYKPAPFCFWDEPDNYLAPDEVQHFVIALRQAFQAGSQFIATSHNPEAIRSFSNENTLVLFRKNHFEPTVVRLLETLQIHGDLVDALTRGDVEP
jgi:predicted ATPase